MKNEQRPFLSLRKSFDEWVRAMPKSERAKLKELKKWDVAFKTASELLVWSKLAPQVEEDSSFFAKWASHDLKANKGILLKAAERNDKRFFIDLGKCLSGEMNPGMHDKMDECVALILAYNPSILARKGVRALEKLGCPSITEDNFRVRKQRLKRAVGKFGFHITARKQRSQRKRRPRH
jgi:hypothetical protein